MTLFYDFKPGPQKVGSDETPQLYPHVISNGTITTRKLLKRIASRSTFSPGVVEAIFALVTDEIVTQLLEGYRVQLGEIGYFSLKLKTNRVVTDKKQVRSESVHIDNVNFRAAKGFRKRLKEELHYHPDRVFRCSLATTPEERKTRLINYLQKAPFITCSQYMGLNGVLRKKALQDLKQFVKEGILTCTGRGTHLIFTLSSSK